MWVISVPVWSQKYIDTFGTYAVPALRAALADFKEPFRFIIHTDNPAAINDLLKGFDVETRSVPNNPTYVTLQYSHGDAITQAHGGDRVVLLNADLVVSGNLFSSCAHHVSTGKKAIVTTGIRTVLGVGDVPPAGAPPRELLSWAWSHRHQIIRDLEWGSGASMLPTNLFFIGDGSVVLHGFHLHPVCIVKEREISFISTIDGDLLDHFSRSDIHVVAHPDDLAMLEISDAAKRFPIRPQPFTPIQVAASMTSRASELHRWLFRSRIVVKGDGQGCNTSGIVDAVLRNMGAVPHAPGKRASPPLIRREPDRLRDRRNRYR